MVNAASFERRDGRRDDEPRPLQLTLDFVKYPEGSVLARAGDTVVVCNVTVEGRVPPFLRDTGEGWLTSRVRDAAARHRGAQPARVHPGLDLRPLGRDPAPDRTLAARLARHGSARRAHPDGGLRRAAGRRRHPHHRDHRRVRRGRAGPAPPARSRKALTAWPVRDQVAAVSVGIVAGRPLLDLAYEEDSRAAVDLNLVGTARKGIVEVQGTAEREPYLAPGARRRCSTSPRAGWSARSPPSAPCSSTASPRPGCQEPRRRAGR